MKRKTSVLLLLSILALSGCDSAATSISPESNNTNLIVCSDDNKQGKYKGRNNKTVLDLLIESDKSAKYTGHGERAFVTTVCSREADAEEREFWASYVDNKLAQKGAGALETNDSMLIEWKLEKY